MKHQYEDYIEWIDEKIKSFTFYRTKINGAEIAIASLLANKATLERHKPVYQPEENANGTIYDGFWACAEKTCWHKTAKEDDYCPSLLDVTNQLDEVM